MTDPATYQTLLTAVAAYFDTMFDGDLARFDRLFAPTATLHGLRDGALRVLPVADYRSLLASTPSPKSKNAPRLQDLLLVDFASPAQALVKVRVRIDQPSRPSTDGILIQRDTPGGGAVMRSDIQAQDRGRFAPECRVGRKPHYGRD